jgi:para-aminobenzoate synthetase component 1
LPIASPFGHCNHSIHVEHLGSLDAFGSAQALSCLPDLVFLDSALRHPVLGRYSFVAADPFGRLIVRNGQAVWNGESLAQAPLSALRSLLDRFQQPGLKACLRSKGVPRVTCHTISGKL